MCNSHNQAPETTFDSYNIQETVLFYAEGLNHVLLINHSGFFTV